MYLRTKITPQIVGKADFAILAVTATATIGGINRLIHRVDDLRNKNVARRSTQPIAAARTSDTSDYLRLT